MDLKKTLLMGLVLACLGCNRFPKDPEKTLEKAQNGVLLVGFSENPPWVTEGDNSVPGGIEAELVKEFAREIGAQVKWNKDTEQNLFEDLEKKNVHLVISGITDDNPWNKKVALTRPYVEQDGKKHVMATIKGENAFVVRLEKFLHKREDQLKAQMNP